MSSVLTEEGPAVDGGREAVALVIDADGHCSEPWQELGNWMPPEFANKGPTEYDGRIVWEDHVVLRATGRDPGPRGPYADTINTAGRPGQEDPVQRLRDMDYEGIDVAVIFGALTMFAVNGLEDCHLAAAACRGFNNWLLEYMSADPIRLKGVGLIPCQDSARAGGGNRVVVRPPSGWDGQRRDAHQRLWHQLGRSTIRSDLRSGTVGRHAVVGASADDALG